MKEKILDFLKRKQEGYLSGDQISNRLRVSRQALWKHIQELRDLGYDIAAVPHLGYRLISSPDRLFPCEINYHLNTKFIGKKIYYYDSISSTMDTALQLGLKGSPEGTLVVAETQTKGRGRLGRDWFSPKYKGIYLSLILRPKILPNQASILTLFSAVSVCEAIREKTDLDIKIKWPNDLLLNNHKFGGILTELSAEMDEVHFIAIGIGLNVNNDKKTLVAGAASLKKCEGEDINRADLLREILRKMEVNYLLFQEKGSAPIIEKWQDYNITLGRRTKILSHQKYIEGDAVDIDIDGGLLIRNDQGIIQKVMAGDAVHYR